MSFSISVTTPPNNAHYRVAQQYQIFGTIQGRPANDPPVIASVAIQGAGTVGPVTTQPKGGGQWTFSAQGTTHTAGVFLLSVIVTDEDGHRTTASVTVFVGVEYTPTPPAVLIDVVPSALTLFFSRLAPKLQAALAPLEALLYQAGGAYTLVGPNESLNLVRPPPKPPSTSSVGTERIALWLVETSNPNLSPPVFNLIPPSPPASTLSTLPASAVIATFAPPTVPLPTVADPTTPSMPLDRFAFALSISLTALQTIARAMLPLVQARFNTSSLSVEDIAIQCLPPSTVRTEVGVNYSGIGAKLTIDEELAVVMSPLSPTGQRAPHVTGMAAVDTTLLTAVEAILTVSTIFTGLILCTWAGPQIDKANVSANNALSLANASLSSLPVVISLRAVDLNTEVPFPGFFFDWTSLTVNASGITGAGTLIPRPRTSSDAVVTISGPDRYSGAPIDFVGGASGEYIVRWSGIVPDPNTFTMTIDGADALVIPIPQGGSGPASVGVTFAFPSDPPRPRHYHFTLRVRGTETSTADSTKTISATATLPVSVLVFGRELPDRS